MKKDELAALETERPSGAGMSASSHTQRRSRRKVLVPLAMLALLLCWATYMLWWVPPSTLKLPDGTTVMFRGVTEGTHDGSNGHQPYEQSFTDNRGRFLLMIYEKLPSFIARLLPKPESGPVRKTYTSSPKAIWFSFQGHLWHYETEYSWVDEHGYETAASPTIFDEDNSFMMFEGCVPRGSPMLHLRIRAKEKWSEETLGTSHAGKILGEQKFRNPLHEPPSNKLSAQPLPVTVNCHQHRVSLVSAKRARVVSEVNQGMVFRWQLEDGQSAGTRFQMDKLFLEDGTGNRLNAKYVREGPLGLYAEGALWKDNPVWKLSALAWRLKEADYRAAEIHPVQGIPITGEKGDSWEHETTLMGHQLRFSDPLAGADGSVQMSLTVTPGLTDKRITLLKARAETEQGPVDLVLTPTRRPRVYLRQNDAGGTKATIYLPPPGQGRSLEAVFALDTGAKLEFAFQPEFEP